MLEGLSLTISLKSMQELLSGLSKQKPANQATRIMLSAYSGWVSWIYVDSGKPDSLWGLSYLAYNEASFISECKDFIWFLAFTNFNTIA